ncbi:uncharacterized protein SEPMUDRAFT_125000 [Sphaerulina musiva SO2202]|uniref:Uncharacterized protein n=1 Tax=Sphaerulina musiva (strain SO2202) TaxID=692275 RepID=M3D5H9_SPHMS|nr:uncharacterized protein SEPMUDRAFT_125000 [Sphaerulina musiva SO2202]EMF13144.1 hypothetical protein SEPMUDRAFT_125000 [Sphaerulina musiva SO2202]
MQKRRLGRIVLIIDVRFLGIGSPPESVLPAIADLHSTVPGLSSWLMHRYLLSDPNSSTTAQAHVWLYLECSFSEAFSNLWQYSESP